MRRGTVRAAVLLLALIPAGCASRGERPAAAVTPATADAIRRLCPEGTFIGTMTADCPRAVE